MERITEQDVSSTPSTSLIAATSGDWVSRETGLWCVDGVGPTLAARPNHRHDDPQDDPRRSSSPGCQLLERMIVGRTRASLGLVSGRAEAVEDGRMH
eukprot:scaffold68808_cov66-Phaeocystis_antarctica.AAC.2